MTRRISPPEVVVLVLLALYLWDVDYQAVEQYRPGPAGLAVMAGATVVLLVAQVIVSVRAVRRFRDRRWPWVLLTQGVAFAVGTALFPGYWPGLAGFLAASVALLLPPRVSVPVAVAACVSVGVVYGVWYSAADGLYGSLAVIASGAAPWALTRFADLTDDLVASRGTVVQLAVLAERERSGADLETLLGVRLRTVQDAAAAAELDPQLATGRIRELVDVSRGALSDVRSVARGERGMSIAVQLEFARAILAADGIGLDTDISTGTIPPDVDALLADVVREGVTSTLESGATSCRIRLAVAGDGVVELELSDDGRGPDVSATLRSRIVARGGDLRQAAQSLSAAIPVT